MPPVPETPNLLPRLLVSGAFQMLAIGLLLLFIGENELVAGVICSHATWESLVRRLGAEIQIGPSGMSVALPLSVVAALAALATVIINGAGAGLASVLGRRSWLVVLPRLLWRNALWAIPLVVWSLLWIVNLSQPGMPCTLLLIRTVQMTCAVSLAGWLWEALRLTFPDSSAGSAGPPGSIQAPAEQAAAAELWWARLSTGLAMLLFVLVLVSMNFGLWFNLQIPHGDSSMYEEHLWNVLHGKGFRSYLDQGLFLGEHVQVIHLLLLPLYCLWPSHLLLELCGSLALALGAIPVFQLARRFGGSPQAAALMAMAFLLYFPLQFLDISIDLKTFRPTALAVPLLLAALLCAERRQWLWTTFWSLLALSSQEDFAVALASLGLWLAVTGAWEFRRSKSVADRTQMIYGAGMCLCAGIYVVVAVKLVIPWFHGGATVHYASYFQDFGKTPVEIVLNILTRPGLLAARLFTTGTLVLLLDLLVPVGVPWRAWSRLLVALPLFILLALNELTKDYPGPFHHFHAAIVPLIFWAGCAALAPRPRSQAAATAASASTAVSVLSPTRQVKEQALWAVCCAATTGLFFSLTPLGIPFWDAGSPFYWQRLYVPGERAREFAKVLQVIPLTARVASTDFVHPRFTHFERSYDYSHYLRKVADYEDRVPADTDYIVIDTGHRYSEIHRLEEMREYRQQPDQWEQVPIDTKGYYIVLKRVPAKSPMPEGTAQP